jgi:aconitase family protein (aconitate hydratase)
MRHGRPGFRRYAVPGAQPVPRQRRLPASYIVRARYVALTVRARWRMSCEAQSAIPFTDGGCASSRESAVYALHAFGARSIVAPSFDDIFTSNCLKNGLLPVRVGADVAADLRRQLHAMSARPSQSTWRSRPSPAPTSPRTASTSIRCASAAGWKVSTTSR